MGPFLCHDLGEIADGSLNECLLLSDNKILMTKLAVPLSVFHEKTFC